jgi:hypothetical protein
VMVSKAMGMIRTMEKVQSHCKGILDISLVCYASRLGFAAHLPHQTDGHGNDSVPGTENLGDQGQGY